jgi:hypothetical protein
VCMMVKTQEAEDTLYALSFKLWADGSIASRPHSPWP